MYPKEILLINGRHSPRERYIYCCQVFFLPVLLKELYYLFFTPHRIIHSANGYQTLELLTTLKCRTYQLHLIFNLIDASPFNIDSMLYEYDSFITNESLLEWSYIYFPINVDKEHRVIRQSLNKSLQLRYISVSRNQKCQLHLFILMQLLLYLINSA